MGQGRPKVENRARTPRDDGGLSLVDERGRRFIARKHHFPANAAGFLLAPVAWMLYFIAVYSLQGAGCAVGLDSIRVLGTDALHLVLGSLTAAASLLIVVSGVWSFLVWRRLLADMEGEVARVDRRSSFLAYGALLHAALFLVATLWSGIPIMLLDSACDNLGTA